MIQLTGAAKRFGPKTLFENLDWLVTPNERAGIVGANGTGKSTLLKILAGMDGLDAGTIVTMKGASVGYLPQEGLSLSGRTVFAECMTVFADLLALEQEQETLAHKLSELAPAGPEYAQVADRFHRAEGEFRARDGFAIEAQVGMVLSGLGFPQRQWTKRTEEFSGGWQMRIALAKLLLEKPNLLLLDEPTNHLDLEARNWLEGYLEAYPHAFVLVSHDRYFLDVTVRKLLELWNKRVHFYTGGYSRYDQQKAERLAQLEAAYANQQDRITQLEAFINRFRAQATKAKQVQSRIKELERIERIEIPPARSSMDSALRSMCKFTGTNRTFFWARRRRISMERLRAAPHSPSLCPPEAHRNVISCCMFRSISQQPGLSRFEHFEHYLPGQQSGQGDKRSRCRLCREQQRRYTVFRVGGVINVPEYRQKPHRSACTFPPDFRLRYELGPKRWSSYRTR